MQTNNFQYRDQYNSIATYYKDYKKKSKFYKKLRLLLNPDYLGIKTRYIS